MVYENTPTLETERLILRKFNKNDVESLFEILRDEEVNTFLPWFSIKNIEETEKFLQEKFFKYYNKKWSYPYAICLKENNKPIGYAWFSEDESKDFGYGIKKEFWNKGIATEASRAIVEKIKEAGYLYITATHDINNQYSGQVVKKLGMKYKYSYIEKCQPKDIHVTFRMYQLNFDDNEERTYMEYWNKYKNGFKEEIKKC